MTLINADDEKFVNISVIRAIRVPSKRYEYSY